MARIKINYPNITLNLDTFGDLTTGDLFEYNNTVYIKVIPFGNNSINAINITTGNASIFERDSEITILKDPELTFKY